MGREAMIELPRLFTLQALQIELKRLGADVSIDTLRREIWRGRLESIRIGRRVFVTAGATLAYLGRTQCPDSSSTASPTPSSDAGADIAFASGPDASARQQSAASARMIYGPPKSERTSSPPARPRHQNSQPSG
jgi:hypothetical protein